LRKFDTGDISSNDAVSLMINISKIAEEAMGGTSGALYSCVLFDSIKF
jgi:dihydroxyacetone kinase